ncbi:MAG TPA: hypothetical protein VJV79_40780 [Polyangiaceae bacterium]|nr:hypothetical protein [Polyangiaceae bacterium]
MTRSRAAFMASKSAFVRGGLAPFGNPRLEVTAEGSNKDVIKDVAVRGSLWLPVEVSAQRSSRLREAEDFVALHSAGIEVARASAAARAVRAYGRAVVAVERSNVLAQLLANARAESRMLSERMASGDAVRSDASLAAAEAARHEIMMTENEAELVSARGELAELVGEGAAPPLEPAVPPVLAGKATPQTNSPALPRSRAFLAEARYHDAAAERARREGRSLLSVGVVAGRGDYGETRIGGGLAYAFPTFRSNQVETARNEAESQRARTERRLFGELASRRLLVLRNEQQKLLRALSVLSEVALPAARAAVSAVQETYEAGKAELLSVLLTRRELSTLSLRRLALFERSWILVADYVEITGDLP